MKYLLMSEIVIALVGAFVLISLGLAYMYEGVGLHPALAGLGVAILGACGWKAACIIDEIEADAIFDR